MAHFYGEVNGRSRTSAYRCGTKGSGLSATANGWTIGAHVVLTHEVRMVDGVKKEFDCITIYATGGSRGSGKLKVVYEGEVEV